jgi:hypothetical protein
LIPEDKTTGMIKFDHVNKYEIIAWVLLL